MDQQIQKQTQDKLAALSADVHEAFVNNGVVPLDADCHTECSVTIGPDGKPVYQCKLVCGF
ncbi:hypothetical protein [Burkholderia sp. AU16741]|uniref:hypothetical protein n=1 Tax=Burkholderia sp. AU16741 TaxID=2015347 RepID=UPI00117CF2CF|nr:hypothetical protein [Burkholderia sp. AU16741]